MKEFKAGINHIEFWVKNLDSSLLFYSELFKIIGWTRLNDNAFSTGNLEIYFVEKQLDYKNSLGVRHICFQATNEIIVEEVFILIKNFNLELIRGPKRMGYSKGYYTVDFRDPNGCIIEVAYTPNMKM